MATARSSPLAIRRLSHLRTDSGGIIFGDGLFVAASTVRRFFTSSDGANWTDVGLAFSGTLHDVAFANETFVAVGERLILTSTDGISWADRTLDSKFFLRNVIYGRDAFIAVGDSGALSHVIAASLYGVTYGHGKFVAVGGEYGVILQSDSFIPGYLAIYREPNDESVEVLLGGEMGRSYRLQSARSLSSSNWVDLVSFTLTESTTNFVDSPTYPDQRFYRLVQP